MHFESHPATTTTMRRAEPDTPWASYRFVALVAEGAEPAGAIVTSGQEVS